MIGKTLLSQSFEATLRYVYSKPDATVVDTNFAACYTNDPVQIAQAMTATANGRSKKPCYHISLSPAEGDRLEMDDWRSLCQDFLSALGLSTHETVAVLHKDATYPDGEERPHLHLVVNRYESPASSARAACLHFPQIERVIRKLEQDYELESIPCSWEVDRRGDAPGQFHRTEREQTASVRTQVQESIDEAILRYKSVQEFVDNLQTAGITTHLLEQGISYSKDDTNFAGYQLGKDYIRAHIEAQIGGSLEPMTNTVQVESQRQQVDEHDEMPVTPVSKMPRSSMADVMQRASAQSDPEEKREAAPTPPSAPSSESTLLSNASQTLEGLGHHIGSQQEGIDGMMLGGASLQVAATALTLADAFLKHLEAARQKAQSDRAQALLDQLEQIGERTTKLENLASAPAQAKSEATFETSPSLEEGNPSAPASLEPDPIADSLQTANQRLEQLESAYGLPLVEREPMRFDRSGSIDQQLDQMEAAIRQLDERLGQLETVMLVEQPPLEKIAPETVAETLANYVQARAEYYNLAPTDPIPTRSMGTIEYSNDGNEIVAIVEPDYGAKFEAVKLGDQWEITSNDLSDSEIRRISGLPQTSTEYEAITQSKEILRYFQEQAPKQFGEEGGRVLWKDANEEFSYVFDITTNRDESQTVIGVDQRTEKPVLQARIADDSIHIDRAAIPKEHAASLLNQRELTIEPEHSEAQAPRARLTQRQRHRQNQELSL